MDKDYSKGRYRVLDQKGAQIGVIDEDEFVRDANNKLIYRIDGDEVYSPGAPPEGLRLLATIENDEARTSEKKLLFRILDE